MNLPSTEIGDLKPIRNEAMDYSQKTSSSPFVVAVCWFVVLVPLSWGVVQSVAKSLPLFQMSTATKPVSSTDRK